MEYTISYTEKSIKYLESLDKKEAKIIFKKIESIKGNPLHYIQRLTKINLWKLKIGDYRAIIKFDRVKKEITIVDIGHRKNIYKKV